MSKFRLSISFILILIVASFLRLYNIPNTVQFLGDQGRDAIVVARIFKDLDLVFIGPVTSVGNMYLGPLYYYFMVPFLMLTYPSPMGPVYIIALLGILTVFLMYFLGRQFLSDKVAFIAASLFGLSAIVSQNTRFSWNPNPAPIISLLLIFFLFKAVKKNVRYWVAVFICFSVLIQLHYLTLLSAAGFGLIWLYQLYENFKNKQSSKNLTIYTIIGILFFIISLSPLILFDLKHDGLNRKAFISIFTKEKSFVQDEVQGSNSISNLAQDARNRTELILTDITIGEINPDTDLIISFLILSILIFIILSKYKKNKPLLGELIILSFLLTGILGTTIYKHAIYHHYIAYLFPITFFAIAIVLDYIFRKNLFGKVLTLIFIILFVKFNYIHAKEVIKSTGWTIAHTQGAAKTIEDRVKPGEKYDIVLLTRTGDIEGQNYRYFLSTSDKPPVDKQRNGEIDTLFIINDDKVLDRVVDSPVYEIVVFPNKNPSEVYQIDDGPEITVLRRN